jgi:hypothetical protein
MPLHYDTHEKVVEPEEPLRRRRPLLHPSRWPVVAGLATISVAAFLPWETVRNPGLRPSQTNGLDNYDAPGAQLFVFAAATLVLAALPVVASSRLRIVQLLPALLGICTLIIGIEQYQSYAIVGMQAGAHRGEVALEGGLWSSIAGALLVAIGGVLTSALIGRDRPAYRDFGQLPSKASILRPAVAVFAGLSLAVGATILLIPVDGGLNTFLSMALVIVLAPTLTYAAYTLLTTVSGGWRVRPARQATEPDHTRYMRKSGPSKDGG